MRSQKGQVILILILVMTVALAIGLSVIQRSLSDISTSSKVEQSSRAFSAAEAGIEKALSEPRNNNLITVSFPDNNSSAEVNKNEAIPAIPASFETPRRQDPIKCSLGGSEFAKEDIAQIWLADPKLNLPTCSATDYCYKQTSLDVYWGDSSDNNDKAALEVTIVYYGTDPTDLVDGSTPKYRSRKWYLDHLSATRATNNGFEKVLCNGGIPELPEYQCQYTLGSSSDPGGSLPSSPSTLILLRARLLYSSKSQPFAVRAAAGSVCRENDNTSGCIPTQAKILVSTGTSGQTQRKIQVCQFENVVPPYFDYAIFSAGDINK